MKKNSFLEGAFIATISVILCKVLGLIYVIPFRAIIGQQGGALYGYAYTIYSVFLSLATVGIPTAISKIVSEYNALEYQHVKQRAYKLGSKILIVLGLISFILLFIFAPQVAVMIKGNADDGNSIESITFVIRTISTALIIVPSLSNKRGYLQGHNFMAVPQFSAVIEQFVRVIIVVAGSFLAYKVFNLSLDNAVAIAVFGATLGALVSYWFVSIKIKKNKDKFNLDAKEKKEEKELTNKEIIKKIVYYALPLVLIDLVKSLYEVVDMFTVVRTLTDIGFSGADAENVFGTISTWASKLNMIVISISIGLCASLIPNIMPSFVKNNFKDVEEKINKTLQLLSILIIPMTFGLAFLGEPVWVAFYGYDKIGISLFHVYCFLSITTSFQLILVEISQIMNNTKLSFGSLFVGIILKLILNIPIMYLFNKIGITPYYGSIVSTMIAHLVTITIVLIGFKKKYHFNYNKSLIMMGKALMATLIMIGALYLLNMILPISGASRLMSIVLSGIYAIIGAGIYFLGAYLLKVFDGVDFIGIIKRKLKRGV